MSGKFAAPTGQVYAIGFEASVYVMYINGAFGAYVFCSVYASGDFPSR